MGDKQIHGLLLYALTGLMIIMSASVARSAASLFDDDVAVWHMTDLNDAAATNSALTINGAVTLGEKMESGEYDLSLSQGGDGHAARFDGGCLNGGQGAAGELNLSGQAMSLFISLQDPEGRWNCGIFSKHGGQDKLVYNLFAVDFGGGMELGFELGIAGRTGAYQVRTSLATMGLKVWHDVIVTYDGAALRLYADGTLRKELAVTGSLRTGNTEPCLVGTDVLGGSAFHGLIDHAALWNRALSPEEIKTLGVRMNQDDQTAHQHEVDKANTSVDAVKQQVARPLPAQLPCDRGGAFHQRSQWPDLL